VSAAETSIEGRFVRAGLLVGCALLAAQSGLHLFGTLGLRSCHTDLGACDTAFDLWRNNGPLDLVSLVLILGAVLGAAALAVWDRSARFAATTLAVVFMLIAIDDSLQEDDLGSAYGLVVAATLIAAGLLVVAVALRTPSRARAVLLGGLVLLAVDVKVPFAYDQLMNVTGHPALGRGDVLYELGIVLDEGLEVMAWTLLATGLWAAAAVARERAAREGQATRSPSPVTLPRP
jgi:hypothetical protein